MRVVRNDVRNKIELHNQELHNFSLQEPPMLEKFRHFEEYVVFWSNLEGLREKRTVQLRELVMEFIVVVNNIVDIIHLDQNTVLSNLKELCMI